MIGYYIKRSKLRKKAKKLYPNWDSQAAASLKACHSKKGFIENSKPHWSKIKSVYSSLQHQKCAYCEKRLGSEDDAKYAEDMEHFRPKNSVEEYVPPAGLLPIGTVIAPVPKTNPGYYWLAFEAFNYATSCKVCNTKYKGTKFPILGTYTFTKKRPEDLLKLEQPLLIYPVGDFDDKPEDLIEFKGAVAVPKHAAGLKRLRALVTIDLLGLNDTSRLVFRQRQMIIEAFYHALEYEKRLRGGDPAKHQQALDRLKIFLSPKYEFSNCLKCFYQVYLTNPPLAEQYFDQCQGSIMASG